MTDHPNTTIGRPARIVSISFPVGRSLDEVGSLVDAEGQRGCDLIALPETFLGQAGHEPEPLDGPTVQLMSTLARRHHTYIVCPLDRRDGGLRLNSAVLLDRAGSVACVYDKVYPFWSEFDVQPPVSPGSQVPVCQTDFGRVGMAICFDVNFAAIWQQLADQGAELVIWASAYSAGTSLQAHALNHHYYIVSATQESDCFVYDITGEQILYARGDGLQITRVTLDLDRGIYHYDFHLDKRDRLLAERGQVVTQEKALEREKWIVLRATQPGVSARELARQYGLEELRDYIARSRQSIDALRGSPFRSDA
ncbi:MAG: carbon-nitrogen hydrolase family protein [Chloroflexi bacterium]|jgi:predicted amidohydrolase|nr:carbon-nitrogen hydrolase family protein [Chloroflexota bacterium]